MYVTSYADLRWSGDMGHIFHFGALIVHCGNLRLLNALKASYLCRAYTSKTPVGRKGDLWFHHMRPRTNHMRPGAGSLAGTMRDLEPEGCRFLPRRVSF